MQLSEYHWPSRYDKPFSHQIDTTKFIIRNPRSFVLSGLGSGKTLSCLWAFDFLRVNERIKKVLIVTPLSTIHAVWQDTIWNHLPHRQCVALVGTKSKKLDLLERDAMFYIINHDGIKNIEDELIKYKFDIVCIDEITAYGNHTSQRSKSMYNIARKARGVIGLTGTPVANSPLTAFSLAKIVNPSNPELPKSFYKFRELVCKPDYTGFNWLPKEGHEKVVASVLYPSIRFNTRDCIDLPPVINMDRDVELSLEVMNVYKTVKKDLYMEFKQGKIVAANAATKMIKLLQVSSGGVIDDSGNIISMDCSSKVKEIIATYEENGETPTLISAVFTESIKYLDYNLRSKGYRVDYVDGSRTGASRGHVIRAFQNGELDFLILQPKSASHGLNLQNSNLLINFSPVYSNEVAEQLYARISRPGQKRTQLIVNLISTPTEKRFYKALQEKARMSDVIMMEFGADV